MPRLTGIVLIKCSFPKKEAARELSEKLVSAKLVACAQIVGPVESHFLWNGVAEAAEEYLILLKTAEERVDDVIDQLRTHHSYDLPEIVVTPISDGYPPYLDWVLTTTR